MPFEDIEIRINKKGEVFVRIEGATERRLNDYRAFLEEEIGPIKEAIELRRPEWARPAGELTSETEEEKRRREQELSR